MPIRKVSGGYKIANTKGISKTLAAAKRRLQAIKANQNMYKKGKKKKTKKTTRKKKK